MSYTASFSGAKSSQTNSYNNYNPSLTANMRFSVTQPLIQNRGTYVNRIPLMMAQSNYRISEYALRQQLLTLVNTAETAYWNVISARENVRVAESGRNNASEFLKYMQKQLELGALSPLDIYNPQQSLANAELSVSQAKFDSGPSRGCAASPGGRRPRPGDPQTPDLAHRVGGPGACRFHGRGSGAGGGEGAG